ncbi:hypothetical protein H8Z72_23465 (plasmid) [Xanthomonas citri pv. citri]|uniref:hypothetical protein n=1 Tax=Xanthomonas citri TaxID=346 RepID=UPI00193286B5|nr:hypothetical protein [Xanthomonas citri]QRD62726.1 hypothetical protein H8Z74_22720 [Xanthomonas citri pv. citri]QRD67053.1 hypothetical protein H8Z73_22805 [Xanthomonas citri pv. citri]QRD71694.1 hypothetical protein H8Z72_23465 [Xanthomonas citri pv. citri]
MATLLAPLLYEGQMAATVPLAQVGQSLNLPADAYAQIAPFVRELHARRVIKSEDWHGATANNAGEVLVELAQIGAQRIVDEVAELIPSCGGGYVPFYVAPQALVNIAADVGVGGMDVDADVGQTFVAMTDHSPFVIVQTPDTTEERSAICCLIAAINDKSGSWLMVPPNQAIEVIDPMLSELVTDLKIALRGQRLTVESLPASMRDMIEDWYGEIPSNPDDAEAMLEQLRGAVEAAQDCEAWQMGDGKIEAWLAKGEGRNPHLVQRLYDFWKALPACGMLAEREVIEDGYCADLFVMWKATWDSHQSAIQSMAEYYEPAEVFRFRRKTGRRKAIRAESAFPQVDSFRAAVMATSVATATIRIILDACPD